MLGGNEDVVDTLGLDESVGELLVLDDDLGFAVWSQPWNLTVLSLDCHIFANLIGQNVGVRVESLRIPLRGSVSKHKSLISSSEIALIFRLVDSSSDVGILSVNIEDNLALVAIEANVVTGEAHLLANSSGDLLKVDLRFVDADFSEEDNLDNG